MYGMLYIQIRINDNSEVPYYPGSKNIVALVVHIKNAYQ